MGDVINFPVTGKGRGVAVTEPVAPTPDTGKPQVMRCRDIPGECCHKCHDFADDGQDPLMTLLDKRLRVTHSVCCLKFAEATQRRDNALAQERLGKPPHPRLLMPTNECIK